MNEAIASQKGSKCSRHTNNLNLTRNLKMANTKSPYKVLILECYYAVFLILSNEQVRIGRNGMEWDRIG